MPGDVVVILHSAHDLDGDFASSISGRAIFDVEANAGEEGERSQGRNVHQEQPSHTFPVVATEGDPVPFAAMRESVPRRVVCVIYATGCTALVFVYP